MEVRIRKNGEKEALWKTRIEACAQSGLSEKAFCKREGIALSTFRYWKANVRIRPNNPILKKAKECDKTF